MAAERAPAFQFYPKDFLINVMGMTLAERGRLFTRINQAVLDKNRSYLEQWNGRFIGRIYWREKVNRPYLPPAIRAAVLDRDGSRCRNCGSDQRIELDHIVPFSRGGPATAENLQVLCKPCNRRKGARVEHEVTR